MLDIDFKARNPRGKFDASKKVPTDYIPTLEDQLQRAEESLSNIAKEIEFARRQEILLRQTSGIIQSPSYYHIILVFNTLNFMLCIHLYIPITEKTKSRIQWFSALSIVILVVTSLWQLIYLRKYFTDKKLL